MPKNTDDEAEIAVYKKEFVELSKGKYTWEDVERIPIYIRTYKVFDSRTKTWVAVWGGPLGTCYPFGWFTFIVINKQRWDNLYLHISRRELIFHELGHCLMGREHTYPNDGGGKWKHEFERWLFKNGYLEIVEPLSDGCPGSLMHPHAIDYKCLYFHQNYYIEEFFKRTTRDKYENGY